MRLEHAIVVARFLGLAPLETNYLLGLVQFEEAGTAALKEHFQNTLSAMRAQAHQDADEPKRDASLSFQEQIQYYSNWYYSAAHVAVSIPGLQSMDALSERLGVEKQTLRPVLDFLVSVGLCRRRGENYEIAVEKTAIDRNSLMIDRHLLNWRASASEHVAKSKPKDLFFTQPMAIDAKAAAEIRSVLLDTIRRADKILAVAPSKELHCLNLDWFEL